MGWLLVLFAFPAGIALASLIWVATGFVQLARAFPAEFRALYHGELEASGLIDGGDAGA